MAEDRVVITGAGVVCSLGKDASEVWEALLAGKAGVGAVEGFDAKGFASTCAAEVQGFHPSDLGIHPRDARIMDTHAYLLMKGAQDAFSNAGLAKTSIPREEISFFAGMGMVDYDLEDLLPAVLKSLDAEGELDYSAFYIKGYTEIYPLWPLSMLNNISFCQVATSLDIQGENTVFSPHGDSGAMAVAEGIKALLDDRARVVLCGGVSEKVSPLSLARAHLSGTLNTTDPQGRGICKPFDRERRGTVPGEGCGVVVLELESSARERGVPCLARMTGYGCSCEIEAPCSGPTSRAIVLAMRGALGRAGIESSEIDLVIAHGDGTVSGDRSEIEAINDVFSECIDRVSVYSSKGAIGHLLAGAPLVDTIVGLSVLRDGIVPRTLHVSSPDPSIRFHLVYRKPLRKTIKKILINCRSYEGQAASLILEAMGAGGRPHEISLL
jgi:3-oxoacyl-[acyl-carrier-protein] synthase II